MRTRLRYFAFVLAMALLSSACSLFEGAGNIGSSDDGPPDQLALAFCEEQLIERLDSPDTYQEVETGLTDGSDVLAFSPHLDEYEKLFFILITFEARDRDGELIRDRFVCEVGVDLETNKVTGFAMGFDSDLE